MIWKGTILRFGILKQYAGLVVYSCLIGVLGAPTEFVGISTIYSALRKDVNFFNLIKVKKNCVLIE